MIWNRDGTNQSSVDKILKRILEGLSPRLRPNSQSYYYKKHSDHQGFNSATAEAVTASAENDPTASMEAKATTTAMEEK